eukprot:462443_1
MAFSTAMNEPYLYNNVNSDSYRTSSYQSQNNSVGYGNSYPSANPSVFNIINPTNSTTPKLQQSFSSPDDMSINKIVTFSDNNSTYSHTYHTHTATSPYPIIKSPYSNTMSGHSQSATTTNISSFSNNISEPSLKSRQSSKSFGGGNYNHSDKIETPTHTINWNELVPMCPNMVMQKCRCKHILKQNKEAKKLWHSCYRINVSNVNYQIDNREIEIAYFDGLYGKLSEYFQCEVDSTRIPSKYEISQSIKHFGVFDVSSDCIDRCHFILFWKWYSNNATNITANINDNNDEYTKQQININQFYPGTLPPISLQISMIIMMNIQNNKLTLTNFILAPSTPRV